MAGRGVESDGPFKALLARIKHGCGKQPLQGALDWTQLLQCDVVAAVETP